MAFSLHDLSGDCPVLIGFKIEAEKKLLQQQIDVQKKINLESELKLRRVKQDFEELQKRLMRSEQNHRNDARSAATRLKEVQEKHYEAIQAQQTIVSCAIVR